MPESSLETSTLIIGLFGGLALFLFGMNQLTRALKVVAGEGMRTVLGRLTTNRFTGVLTGAFVTSVIQSSSVTTVLVVGSISAGLMSLSQSIGVIMGANVGTTITAQIIAFKVSKYALLILAVGFAMLFAGPRARIRQYGEAVMGLGFVFFGMGVMGDAMAPLRDYPPFLDALSRMDSPWLGIAAGALFTALVQSSSATTGIVIVMASQGLITLPTGIALIFGSNIGTCITALLGSIGMPREAARAALIHVIFNVAGVVVWFGLIDWLAEIVTSISPAADELDGTARLAADTPRQVANAHTIFNVANTLLFIPFSTQFARLVEWLVPDRPLEEEEALIRARNLDQELLDTPALALDRARLEIERLGDLVGRMYDAILPAVLSGDKESLDAIAAMDDEVDRLHGDIVTYIGEISRGELTEAQTESIMALLEAANGLENIGDIIETNLVFLGRQRIERGVSVSRETAALIREFHGLVGEALRAAPPAVSHGRVEEARQVIRMKKQVNQLADAAALHEAQRLIAEEPGRLPAYTLEVDVLENLRRIYYFAKRMCRVIVRTLPEDDTD